ncbi:MAG: diiron oxygenase [Myxococcales bacterium]|nr:diiron oxygenase [Myxococcales bacterium]
MTAATESNPQSTSASTASEPLPEELTMAVEAGREDAYFALVDRLNAASVRKRFECYRDIEWDAPQMRIDPMDPHWESSRDRGLGKTDWYWSLPETTRREMGLGSVARFMFVGSIFENVLSRGLLQFASRLEAGSPEYRYAYHEVIEESHHSLMFREFVDRSGVAVQGLSSTMTAGADRVSGFGREFPELLFIFALGGEDPIDYAQRRALEEEADMHPLVERISRIHVTEEARHVSFARAYLRHNVPKLDKNRRHELAVATPLILSQMAGLMMRPSQAFIERYQIPQEAVDIAYTNNRDHKVRIQASLEKIRLLCDELELLPEQALDLWKQYELWPEA